MQQVLLEVWSRRPDTQPPPMPYLLRIAARVLHKRHRAERRRREVEGEATPASGPVPSPVEALSAAEGAAWVRAAVAALPLRQRTLVEMVYFRGLSPELAARRLGCSADAVAHRLASARRRLAKDLAGTH